MRRSDKSSRIPLGWCFFVFLFVFSTPFPNQADALGHEFLPPDHWSYLAFERFEILGLLNLPSESPFSRDQAVEFTREIKHRLSIEGRLLTRRDRFNLDRLEKEFIIPGSQGNPRKRYDPPLVFQKDPPLFFESDMDITPSFEKALYDDNKNVFVSGHPLFRLHMADRATYDVRYYLVFGPERGNRARNEKPSPRERSFKGLTSLFERSYVILHFEKAILLFGREYVGWGPSPEGNLLVSKTAGSFDQIGTRVSFGRVRLSFFQAILSPGLRRYLSGHRIEARLGKLNVGVGETVVYGGRELDPIYILPFASFYGNQFNERGDDNVLWALDAKFAVAKGFLLYGSLLMDDFQFERGDNAPDKLAFDVGVKVVLINPLPMTLRLRYRYTDIYTYTHRDSITAHVAGDGNLEDGDALIGGQLGPDSDEWTVSMCVYPRGDVTVEFQLLARRLGEGNDFRSWERPMDAFPPFPLGVIERTIGIGASVLWELSGNSHVSLEFFRAFVENQYHVSDRDKNSTAFRLAASWDL